MHHVAGPLIAAAIAVVILIGTTYLSYNKVVETASLFALIGATVWSWRVNKSATSRTPPR